MKNTRIMLAVIIPLLLIGSGGYYFVTHPPHAQTLVKELIALSAFYAGNLNFLYWDGWDPYVPNATYFCYISTENNVISDHIVEGTKYFFVEKDSFLSRIVEVRR